MSKSRKDRTVISFGKLSDPGVMQKTPLANNAPALEYFTSEHFQYIVDNIVDMFGLAQGTVLAEVEENDHILGWMDFNGDKTMSDDEMVLQFTMNAAISVYRRKSYYGKYYMHAKAQEFGYPVVFGIIAHEVGHLVNRYALTSYETRIMNGVPYLTEVQKVNDRWDELCADYLAGIVLAKAYPRLPHEPMKNFLAGTMADEMHPDGFWRTFAVEMGYQWGCANHPSVTSQILMDKNSLRQLLISFFQVYYQQVYMGVDPFTRGKYSNLCEYMLENCSNPIVRL